MTDPEKPGKKRQNPAIEVFRHRNFTLFMTGLGPAATSSWMQRVGVGWLAWELTGSPFWLAVIAAADLVPMMLLPPVAGVLADRSVPLNTLRLTQWLNFLQAAALTACMAAGVLGIEALFALTLFSGIVHAFGAAARHAVVPYTVPRELVPTAVSLDSALFQASRFIGPMIAGFLIARWGVIAAFAAHTIGTFFYSLLMHAMRMAPPERHARKRNMFGDIADSFSYARKHDAIWPLFIMLSLASVCLRPVQEMLPGFAGDIFQSDATGLAWLTSALGLGAMISALRIAIAGRAGNMTAMCFAGLAGLGISTLGFVATDRLWIGVIFAALSGYTINTLSTSVQAMVQIAVDDSMRARVMSLYTVIFRGMPALGAFAFGALAEWTGLRWAYALAAIICIAGAMILWPTRHKIKAALNS